MTSTAGSPGRLPWGRLAVFLGPAALYVLLFMIVPYVNVLQYSFWQVDGYAVVPAFSFENYARAFGGGVYLAAIGNSVAVATIVTVFSVIIGYALAFYVAYFSGRSRTILYFLVVVPLWTSFLLRAFIWRIILGREGIINGALTWMGLIDEPMSILLFNRFSLCVALVYVFTPFVALPIYAALEKIPSETIEASLDLGAGPARTFWRVLLPLSMPGVIVGAIFTFCLSFGDFVAATLLGGPSNLMISNVIITQFGAAFDWPLGSALAVIVIAVISMSVALISVLEKRHG